MIYKEYEVINNKKILTGYYTLSACTIKYLLEEKIKIDKLILVMNLNGFLFSNKEDLYNKVNILLFMFQMI